MILGHQFYAQIWTKIRSKLHAQENAQATLHPNKEIFKLKKTPALKQSQTLEGHELLLGIFNCI